jgi:MFS family permease
VPICLLLLYLIVTRLPRDRAGSRGEAFDGAGSVLYAAAMFALVYGGTHLAGPRGPAAAWLGAGVAGLAGFVAWEAACAHPVFAVGVLARNRVFLLSNLAAFVNYAATAGSGFLLSLYLQEVKGLSPRGAGTVLLVQPVLQAIVAPLAGRLSDRVEPRFVASCGMVLSALGLLALLRLDAATPLPVILAALGLLGVGFGLFSSPNTNAVMGSVERRDLGVASATVGTMRLTGQLLSMGIVMAALASLLGAAAVTPALAEPFLAATRGCYAVFAALCVAGVFASLARGAVRYSPSRFASSR